MLKSLEASLERLQTDRVDLYYAHKDYPELAIEQIVEAFDGTVRSGGVLALGASNFDADRLSSALATASSAGATPFTALQNEYNLIARDSFGSELQNLIERHGIVMLPYFGLASGYLTGKYRTEDDFKQSMRGGRAKELAGGKGPAVLKAMDDVAAETGASHAAIALAWLRQQPGIPAPIASARTAQQLRELLPFTQLELSEGQLDKLAAAGA